MISLHEVVWFSGMEPHHLKFCNCNFAEFETYCDRKGLSLKPHDRVETSRYICWDLSGRDSDLGIPYGVSARMSTFIEREFRNFSYCDDCEKGPG